MTKQHINIGDVANDRTGDPLRTAFEKVNANFDELYLATGSDVQIPTQTNNGGKYLTTNGSTLSWNTVTGGTTGDITFLGNEIRSVNSHVKLVANSDSGNRRVLQLYTDGVVEIPVGVSGAGIVQSAAGIWLSANGSFLQLNSNGSVDFPLVNSTTSLIRSSGNTTVNSNGKEWMFGSNGNLTLPAGGDIKDSTGTSVLGGGSGATALNDLTDVQTTIPLSDGQFLRYNGNNSTWENWTVSFVTGTPWTSEGYLTSVDGILTLPGALVNSTVAKTGAIIPTTTGAVSNLDISPMLGDLTDATYGPFTLGATTFTVIVQGGNPVVYQLQTQPILTIGDVIGTIDSGDIGGTAGTTTTWTSPTDFPGYGSGPNGSGCVLTGSGIVTGRINIKLTDPTKIALWLALIVGTQVTVSGTGVLPSPSTLDLTGVSGQDGDFYYQEFSTEGVFYQDGYSSIGSVSFTEGGTTYTVSVSNVVQETPTALNLTKSVQKLTEGEYTLANGVEGQIMYMVPQASVNTTSDVRVTVANFRVSTFTGTNGTMFPFRWYDGTSYLDNTGMCTLIFTDGAWQQQGGSWS